MKYVIQKPLTGVEANYDRNSGRVMLSDEENGVILMKDIEIENVGLIMTPIRRQLTSRQLMAVVRKSALLGVWVIMVLIGGLSEDLDVAIDHLSTQKAFSALKSTKPTGKWK